MLTSHAEIRMQQRGIPPLVVDWLQDYGAITYDKHGCAFRYFDKRSRRRLAKAVGKHPFNRMAGCLDTYLVEKGGAVLTVGHRFRRIRKG